MSMSQRIVAISSVWDAEDSDALESAFVSLLATQAPILLSSRLVCQEGSNICFMILYVSGISHDIYSGANPAGP
jgi:hypothetical protein